MTGRSNEPHDIEQVLVSFAPRIYGLLVRLVGRPDVAEDLMQETMLRAFRSLETYRPEGKFRAWIFRIAVNLARDWIRRRPREPATVLDDPSEPSAVANLGIAQPPDAEAQRRDRCRRVEAALARLHHADREVLVLRYYGDLAFKDIAKATGEPLGTVLARAHRALKKLGEMFPEDEL
jgi:RNA polymerase sigma-70 factor (ECF subfamily)